MNQLFNSANQTRDLIYATSCASVSSLVRGLSVAQVIYIANQVIAGGSGSGLYSAFKPAILNEALSLYNEVFDGCFDAFNTPCFDCGEVVIVANITSAPDGVAEPGVLIGVNVFVLVVVLVIIGALVAVYYLRKRKRLSNNNNRLY